MKQYRDDSGRYTNKKNSRNSRNSRIIITAIICLTVLEINAMYLGINGKVLSIILFLIGALAGLGIPTPRIVLRN